MAKKRKPGRPRKDTAREPSGRVKRQQDGPTPELARHRQAVVGHDADPALAESELGRLCAHGYVSRRCLDAGREFARQWACLYGKPTPAMLGYDEAKGGPPSDEAVERATALMDEATRTLQSADLMAYDAVRRVAGCDEAPANEAMLRALQRGLKALGRRWYGYDRSIDEPVRSDAA